MLKVSIIGATGYTGVELLRLLANHSDTTVSHITSESQTGNCIADIYPQLRKKYDLQLSSLNDVEKICSESDVVFIALPHGHAMKIYKQVQHTKARIIDLGADYRFKDPAVYEQWYKVEHTDKSTEAVYGLAELYRSQIKTAKLVANAGCYTTASILALAPLVKNKLVDLQSIIIDAKSGTTGAGRALKLGSLFCEVNENFNAYGVTSHRHTPEIEQALGEIAGQNLVLNFTPHLLPVNRGILATCYVNLLPGVTETLIEQAYTEMYNNEYFIRLLGKGMCPTIKQVQSSNFVDLGWQIDKRTNRIIVMSAIDNLVKGAAGQAIQNMNIMFGLPEEQGLDFLPVYP